MVEQATHLFDLARYLIGEAAIVDALARVNNRPAYPNSDVADVSAALVNFPSGIPGVFSATCILDGQPEIYVKIICEGMLITITQTGVAYESKEEKREVHMMTDPFLNEDRAFIRAIKTNDPNLLYSCYEDALKTHRLCHNILEKYLNKLN